MNTGVLSINFTETVDVSEFVEALLSFGSSSVSGSVATLDSSSVFPTSDTEVVTITLSNGTLNELKLNTAISTSSGNSYLLVNALGVKDMAAVGIVSETKQIVPLVPDTTLPELLSFELDMNNGLLSMVYSEAVNADSFTSTSVTLIGASSGSNADSNVNVTLTGGSTASANGTAVVFNLSVADLNSIKQVEGLATSLGNTFLSATSSTIKDMANNVLTVISASAPLAASAFYSDRRAASLTWYQLDMNAGTLLMNFSETMNLSSLVVAGRLTLQSSANSSASGAEAITLSGEVAATRGDSDTFSIALLTADHEAVKLTDAIGTGSANTYLSFVGTLIADQGGVSVTPATADDGQAAASFVVDGTAPLLVDFDFDLNAGELSLSFSEVVRESTLNPGLLALQDSTTSATSSVPLTGSTVIGSNGPNLTVSVTKLQLDAIKVSRTLCVTNTNCVVALSTAAIKDMAANPVVSVAVTATEFTPDTAAPELITFNYTSGCVVLV